MGFPLNVQLHNSYNESHDFLPSYLLQVDGTRHNIPVELQIQAFIKAIICGQPNSYSNLNPMPYKPTSFRDGCVFPDVFGQHGRNFPARVSPHSYWYRHGNHPQIQIHPVTTRPPRRVPGPGGRRSCLAMGIEKQLVEKDGKTMEKINENQRFYTSH